MMINQSIRYRDKKMNIKLLTEVREEFETSKITMTSFLIEPLLSQRNGKKKTTTIRINSKKNLASLRALNKTNRKQGCVLSTGSTRFSNRTEVIIQQMLASVSASCKIKNKNCQSDYEKAVQKNIQKLSIIFASCEQMLENLYSYQRVEDKIRKIIDITKSLSSPSLEFYTHCILSFVLFIYDSFSLTIYYLDKALKILTNKKKHKFQRRLQILAYQYAAKVFVQRQLFDSAKYLAYMFLRKAWLYNDHQEELNAYDLLGLIELQRGNIALSKYFHHRMCKGALELKQNSQKIMIISNNQLNRQFNKKIDFYVYENITMFAEKQHEIIDIIQKHFKSEAEEESGIKDISKNRMMYTHRSPNRNFKNYHILQRGMIEAKQSPEIHFIHSKNLKNVRKYLNELSGFIFQLRKHLKQQKKMKYQEVESVEQSCRNTQQINDSQILIDL